MAEQEDRARQDIGQDEAYIVNLKRIVEQSGDNDGRNRLWFDMIMGNAAATMAGMNAQMLRQVEQGTTTSGKNAENTIGLNETDHLAAQVLSSPWAEAMKVLLTQITAASTKQAEEPSE